MGPNDPATRTITSDRSPPTAAVDNLLRRALKISDPRNADEVAKGLLARYPDDAAKIKREQMGVPFSIMAAQPVVVAPAIGRPDLTAATDTLERTLTELTSSPDLADVAPEMRGWATIIRRANADGCASAAYAIDANERDRAFAARRTLSDYARLARYAAAINTCAKEIYCRLAQACDRIANVILVLIGDALDNAGVTRSGAVIQVPAATLQSRRDSLVLALRNLLQLDPASDQETWPRGTVAVAQIYRGLQQAGAPDLRALLDEAHLSRQLDDLIDLATGSTPDGLRALGATAGVTVQRLRRFFILANGLVTPTSPPATNFFAQLELFIDSFRDSRAGYRLPFLARSPLLVSSNRVTGQMDQPTERLLRLALERTALADAIDCLCCTCNAQDTEDLIVAGQVLFNIDRAIDLYALGTARNGLGDAEWRAAAIGALAFACFRPNPPPPPPVIPVAPAPLPLALFNVAPFQQFTDIAVNLRWVTITPPLFPGRPAIVNPDITTTVPTAAMRRLRQRQLAAVVNTMIDEERRWAVLVSTIAPLCRQDLLFPGQIPGTRPGPFPTDPIGRLLQLTTFEIARYAAPPQWLEPDFVVPTPAPPVRMPAPVATSGNILATGQPFYP
jgi:hypothetical protein